MPPPLVLVHGIWNLQPDMPAHEAAQGIAESLRPRMSQGLRAAGLSHIETPDLFMAYYAHLLTDALPGSQGSADGDLEALTERQLQAAWEWLVAAGVPEPEEPQARSLAPVRQALGWLVRHRHPMDQEPGRLQRATELLSRIVVTTISDFDAYTSRPRRRQQARDIVARTVAEQDARVLVAHSLGSVVAYEALHAHPSIELDLFVTLGSPLGIPAMFRKLDPEPLAGLGTRPPGVRRWVNIADTGDLVSLPRQLGGLFPVDHHADAFLGPFDPHTFAGYLAEGTAAAAIAPYVSD